MLRVMENELEKASDNGFEEFGLPAELLQAVTELGFTRPTAIQADAIPPARQGRDVLACAQTGSGKTAAFLLPILERVRGKARRVTRALILTPTRELALQIDEHRQQLARHTRVTGGVVIGGVGMRPQEQCFRRGVDIVVATPGRLLDHFQHPYAQLSGLEVLVLDEADRMLDMGFLPDIKRVLRHLPGAPRQTMMFSATMPAPILEFANELLEKPVRINLGHRSAPPAEVAQALYPVPSRLKVALLVELLRRDEIGNVIVFCRTKHRANRVADKLERQGIETARIHGNRSQGQRTEALAGFKAGTYRVLVATDIAARGIDVESLDHVLNFDVPAAPDDYIHRVGRTGRAGVLGDAFTFVAPEEEEDVLSIERKLGRRLERRTAAGFDYNAPVAERLEIPLSERLAQMRASRSARFEPRRDESKRAESPQSARTVVRLGMRRGQRRRG